MGWVVEVGGELGRMGGKGNGGDVYINMTGI